MTATATIRKSSKKAAEKTVQIIARYALKKSGAIAYRVLNGENKQYCCTLSHGKWSCMSESGEQCPASKYSKSHTCYHIEHCEAHEEEYYCNGILVDPTPQQIDVIEQAVAVVAEVEEEDMEDRLARQESQYLEDAAMLAPIDDAHAPYCNCPACDPEPDEIDPWEGLDEEEKYAAWRRYEIIISSKGW